MKKKIIAVAAVVLVAVSVIVFAVLKNREDPKAPQPVIQTTSVDFANAQLGVTVDGWLKIHKIDEYFGRLAVVAENVSDSDVEYAVLTVKTKDKTLTFKVSAMLSGMKAVLLCNESVGADPNGLYTAWQTESKAVFEDSPVMNEDKFEVTVADGSISVKNVCGEDITSDIYIYYKDKKDDLLNGSVTYKICVEGLKAGSQTFVKTPDIDEKTCQVIFTDYDDKKV